jgi:O-6-methylguanine DNA methyltransferase
MISFSQKVFSIVKDIPKGSVLTYKEVAIKAGKPKAYRVVGNILNKNYNPEIPCHRVIRSDGKFGGYNRGVDKKRKLLETELASKRSSTV